MARRTDVQLTDDPNRKPRDDEIDVYGLTHQGYVREENQDHFLVSQLSRHITIPLTSIPAEDLAWTRPERIAFLAMVADGVGGARGGEAASRMALGGVARYVSEVIDAYYTADSANQEAFTKALRDAALRVHGDLRAAGEEDPDRSGMATTLTLWIGLWPHIYLVQVGDSRYYALRDGELFQESRDQTVGQQLVDEGLIGTGQASRFGWAAALTSSIGGGESEPVVKRLDSGWGHVHMLCSDGLTKHVSDERIRDRLSTMTSAKQACEALLDDALQAGGSDNITMIIGRAVRNDEGP